MRGRLPRRAGDDGCRAFHVATACAVTALGAARAAAVDAPAGAQLPPIVVSATRSQASAFELPVAIDAVVLAPASADTLGANISETLDAVPGVLVRNRQNYAQDEQISIRGFGTRAAFGIRGVRLYVDGIPATLPDGSGQISHLNLDSAERIEVMRGPFSALYGNAAAGVIQIFSAAGADPALWRIGMVGGSDGALRGSINWREARGPFDSHIDLTALRSDGYRRHSAVERVSTNARLRWQSPSGSSLTVVANSLAIPEAEDPLGLSREQFEEDPRQATSAALLFDTRKRVRQTQAGAIWERPIGDHQHWRAQLYGGNREVTQFLSVPVAAQANPRSGGGVIDLDGDYRGSDLRWSWRSPAFEFTVGASFDDFDQQRRGYENFRGERLGVVGALRRDETNRVRNLDGYAQLRWDFAADWSLMAGVRHSTVDFHVDDRYILAGNPDDSGARGYEATSPAVGLLLRASASSHYYVNWGAGFETPSLAELGYRSDGDGLNLDLRPARSRSGEFGARFRLDSGIESNLALFRADSRDEIAVATSLGGRSTYRNVARARRQGLEASLFAPISERWSMRLAATWLDARFRSPFLACAGVPCVEPDLPVASGTRIPGVAETVLRAELVRGGERGWRWRTRVEHVGDVSVNDTASESAGAYTTLGTDLGYGADLGSGTLRGFVGVDNVFDRRHIGSVIVNDSNGRYYEPAAGRTFTLGLQWQWAVR
jgi:iron complex outermembrane receptor protein